jgi:hypothetical protein
MINLYFFVVAGLLVLWFCVGTVDEATEDDPDFGRDQVGPIISEDGP